MHASSLSYPPLWARQPVKPSTSCLIPRQKRAREEKTDSVGIAGRDELSRAVLVGARRRAQGCGSMQHGCALSGQQHQDHWRLGESRKERRLGKPGNALMVDAYGMPAAVAVVRKLCDGSLVIDIYIFPSRPASSPTFEKGMANRHLLSLSPL